MSEIDLISEALRNALPPSLQDQVPALAQEIAAAKKTKDTHILTSSNIAPLLNSLAGKEIKIGTSLMSFGEGNQQGDITIRDVAGRDIYNLTIVFSNKKILPFGFHFNRLTAIGAFILLFITIILLTVFFSTFHKVPAIKQLQVGVSDNNKYYILEATLFNPLDREILVKEIDVNLDILLDTPAQCLPNWFELSSEARLTSVEGDKLSIETFVMPDLGNTSTYKFPVSGSLTTGCPEEGMGLKFETSLVLPYNPSINTFYIQIPKVFQVSNDNDLQLHEIPLHDLILKDSKCYKRYNLQLNLITDQNQTLIYTRNLLTQ
jgi:hypothetical protein